MNQGTIGTRQLKKSIIKHVSSSKGFGAGIGEDFILLPVPVQQEDESRPVSGQKEDEALSVSRHGKGTRSSMAAILAIGEATTAKEALLRANNNFYLSGNEPATYLVSIVAGSGVKEQTLRDTMHELTDAVAKVNRRIAGGNTVIRGEGDHFSITITAQGFGEVLPSIKPKEGDHILTFGYAGEYGARKITEEKREELRSRFSDEYLNDICKTETPEILRIGKLLKEQGIGFSHDVNAGGIYRALYELSERSGKGIEIQHDKILIRQDAIELCEFYHMNPYELLSTGLVVAAVKEDEVEAILQECEKEKIPAADVGIFTKTEKIVVSERMNMRRAITLFEGEK